MKTEYKYAVLIPFIALISRDPLEWGRLSEDNGVVREPFADEWGAIRYPFS